MSMSTESDELCKGAFDGTELFAIEGSKKWRSTPDDLEEREKWPKKAKKTFIAAIPTLKSVPISGERECPLTPAMN